MGISCAPDIFQNKMSTLLEKLEFARIYIDNLLCMTYSCYYNHLDKLKIILDRLIKVGLKVNAEKSTFCTKEIEYLVYWVIKQGVKPLPKINK